MKPPRQARGGPGSVRTCAIPVIPSPQPRLKNGPADTPPYEDEPGFCKSAVLDEIRAHNHILTPGRYVGVAATEDDGVPFAERFAELKETLAEQFTEADELSALIQKKLEEVGAHG